MGVSRRKATVVGDETQRRHRQTLRSVGLPVNEPIAIGWHRVSAGRDAVDWCRFEHVLAVGMAVAGTSRAMVSFNANSAAAIAAQ